MGENLSQLKRSWLLLGIVIGLLVIAYLLYYFLSRPKTPELPVYTPQNIEDLKGEIPVSLKDLPLEEKITVVNSQVIDYGTERIYRTELSSKKIASDHYQAFLKYFQENNWDIISGQFNRYLYAQKEEKEINVEFWEKPEGCLLIISNNF